jgi:hypothetical protein
LDGFVDVLEREVQIAALCLFALMYVERLFFLKSLRQPMETMKAKGSATRGILLSFGSVAMPWAKESSRKQLPLYGAFALFHIAIIIALGATFVHAYAKGVLTDPVVYTLVAFLGAGLLVGLISAVRRLSKPAMRAISMPDDYFAIGVVILYFPAAIWALVTDSNWGLTAYFGLTAFLWLYLPWSKISHYLYWPFTRFYHGFVFGRRGVTVSHVRSATEV